MSTWPINAQTSANAEESHNRIGYSPPQRRRRGFDNLKRRWQKLPIVTVGTHFRPPQRNYVSNGLKGLHGCPLVA